LIVWERLHDALRDVVRRAMQEALDAEVDELIGRTRYQRRDDPDQPAVYRNGHGKPRKLTLPGGTIELKRPRVRNLDDPFESRVLPFFVRRTQDVNALLPQLYLHGLALGDFELAMRGLLGDDAPVSPATIARLNEQWKRDFDAWMHQPIDPTVVYLWADGIYVKAGLDDEKAAILVIVAAFADGHKEIVGLASGYRESAESWAELLRGLRRRGMNCPSLVVADGALGLWAAMRQIYPAAAEQRCWKHKLANVLDRLPEKAQDQAKAKLRGVMYAEDLAECQQQRDAFMQWSRSNGWDSAAQTLERDWERMVAYYQFPKEHWTHLRTSNPAESPFSSVRLRTEAARRFKKVANATVMIWKLLMVAQKSFNKLNGSELLPEVLRGQRGPGCSRPAETAVTNLHTY
jgi:transposase-like protein